MASFSKGVTSAFLKATRTTPVAIDLFTIRAIIGVKGLICCFSKSIGIGSKLYDLDADLIIMMNIKTTETVKF